MSGAVAWWEPCPGCKEGALLFVDRGDRSTRKERRETGQDIYEKHVPRPGPSQRVVTEQPPCKWFAERHGLEAP